MKREVWKRAGGRCECLLPTGERCGETRRLELDHIRALALGGASTVANVRVACRAHNQLLARQELGDRLMDGHARKRGMTRELDPEAEKDSPPGLFGRDLRAREPVAVYAGAA